MREEEIRDVLEELNLQEFLEGKEGCALTEALEVVPPSGNKRAWIVISEQAALPDHHHVRNTA